MMNCQSIILIFDWINHKLQNNTGVSQMQTSSIKAVEYITSDAHAQHSTFPKSFATIIQGYNQIHNSGSK